MNLPQEENPFQSPAVAETTAADETTSESRPNGIARAIWGTVAISIVVSAGSFFILPVYGIIVLVTAFASIARTIVMTKRIDPHSKFSSRAVLAAFGQSFVALGGLLAVSWMALLSLVAVLTHFSETSNLTAEGAMVGGVLGSLVVGIALILGIWSWLPLPNNPKRKVT